MMRWDRGLQGLVLLLILALGLYLRLGTAARTEVDIPIRGDVRDYVAYAWNLKTYGVYSADFSTVDRPTAAAPEADAMRPPAYPWLLRGLLGERVDAAFVARVMLAQAWIAELTLLGSVLLAMALLGAWPGLALGALVAASPHQSVYVGYLLTETLYGASLLLALVCAVLALKLRRMRWRCAWAVLAGGAFGLCCLVRPTLDQWVWICLLWLLWPRGRVLRREILALVVGFVLVMSPWWLRNETSLHQPSDPRLMMNTIHHGSYPDFMVEGKPESFGYPYRYDPHAAEIESSWAALSADLRAKFARRPWVMAEWYLIGKPAYFFHWATPEGWKDMFVYPMLASPWLGERSFVAIAAVMRVLYGPLIVLGLLGMLAAFAPRTSTLFGAQHADGLRLLAFLQLFAIAVHTVGAPFARYSVPFRPITFLLAIFLLVWLARSYLARGPRLAGGHAHG